MFELTVGQVFLLLERMTRSSGIHFLELSFIFNQTAFWNHHWELLDQGDYRVDGSPFCQLNMGLH